MLLNPALEIRAPASIDSVRELTRILERDPYDVPALVARALVVPDAGEDLYRLR